jgi:two-component system sensor histidine kinase UhpB
VKVTVNAQEDLDSLTADVALCLYRVTQEALTNVIRHARARAVRVGLSRTGPDVELSVVDDGVGFVTGERIGSGLGLRSIDERVRLAAGHVAVDSRPGHGTSLVVRIPLSPALAAAGEA